ncbi:hypothetical protein BD410DRAFT_825241 [Rickenella mellea]|uniref:F-box domain-containing protein n=1 Tax=Rickenella mellea TaxID=50990 RepID=A0A4Y7QJW3_9AGAM|nr:hypothetical protein BD410DRAFT_825241 [Rickenella mellea]
MSPSSPLNPITSLSASENPSIMLPGDVTRESIDAEICSLKHAILDLKTCRNTLSDLSRLPPEVLAVVFNGLRHFIRDLYTVTQVCRHWRQIAFDFPRLWSNINLAHIKEAREFIIRSKSAPLVLDIPNRLWTSNRSLLTNDVVDLLVQHASRICDLRSLSAFDKKSPLIPLFLTHMPRLRNLTMCNPSASSASPTLFPFPTLQMCPNIKTLVLSGYSTRWNPENIHSLQELYVESLDTHETPSTSELLSILSACPQLQQLTFRQAGPKVDASDNSFRGTFVELPSLQLLTLSTEHEACHILFSSLRIPDTASWDIQCTVTNGDKAVPVTPQWSPSPTQFFSLHVIVNKGTLRITGTAIDADSNPIRGNLALTLTWQLSSEVHWMDWLEMTIGPALGGNTAKLRLVYGNSWEKESSATRQKTWYRLFALFPDLLYFSIANHFDLKDCSLEESFGNAFMEPPPGLGWPRLGLPELRELELLDFNLSPQRGRAMHMLKECLFDRWGHGAELEKLVLRNCNGIGPEEAEELMEDLEDVVTDVQWDGVCREELTDIEGSEEDEDESESDASVISCNCNECYSLWHD